MHDFSRFILKWLLCALAGLCLLSSCSDSPPAPVNPIVISNGISRDTLDPAKSLVRLPSCLTAESPDGSNLDTVAYGSYRDLRRDLGFANQMIVAAGNLIDFYYNSMPDDTLDISPDQKTKRRLWLDSAALYHSRFKVWVNGTLAMELTLSGEDGYGRGYFTASALAFGTGLNPNLTMRMEFDANPAGAKQISVRITGTTDPAQSLPGAPRNLVLHANEANGILTYWGAAFHQVANSLTGDASWCSVFRGKADMAGNHASLNLALASASVADSLGLFNQYGIDSILPAWAVGQVRTMAYADTILAAVIFASAKYGKSYPSGGAQPRATTTDTAHILCSEEIAPYVALSKSMKDSLTKPMMLTFLHLNRPIDGWRILDDLVLSSVQPAYINASVFLGCGVQRPAGVSAVLSDIAALSGIAPNRLANLTIAFEDPAPPDF